MRLALGMTSQAGATRQARLVAMTGMTVHAVLVLGRLVQASQLRGLMTGRAGWGRRRTGGSVRTMTAKATASELAMLRVRFGRVARRARSPSRRPAVRLMTLHALRVTLRRAVRFRGVAAFTRRRLRTAVRFVTVGTLRVPCQHRVLLGRVARRAAGLSRRMMRQARVALATHLVPNALRHRADLLRVAAVAKAAVGFGQCELVGLVALRAGERLVKGLVVVGGLVATAAGPRCLG
jgi:hypothetical protein